MTKMFVLLLLVLLPQLLQEICQNLPVPVPVFQLDTENSRLGMPPGGGGQSLSRAVIAPSRKEREALCSFKMERRTLLGKYNYIKTGRKKVVKK